MEGFSGLGVVPADLSVLHGEAQVPEGLGVAGIAQGALYVVYLEDAGDVLVALPVEMLHQELSTAVVVGQHRRDVGQLGVGAVDEDQADPPLDQLLVQVQVGVGQGRLAPLHQDPV